MGWRRRNGFSGKDGMIQVIILILESVTLILEVLSFIP